MRFYNEYLRNIEQVFEWIYRSDKFGWSWSIEKSEPLRHTAISLYFDDVPQFTVNARAVDGSSKLAVVFTKVTPIISIEQPFQSDVQYFPALQEFAINTKYGEQKAKECVLKLIEYEMDSYNLFINNCRDHVAETVEQVFGNRRYDVLHHISQIRTGDLARTVLFIFVAMTLALLFLAG